LKVIIKMNTHLLETIGTATTAIFTTLIVPTIFEYVKLKINNKHKKKDPIIEEIEYSSVINQELDDIREEFKSSRCWIILYHNGGHLLITKKSLQKFSIMFESCEPGVSSISNLFSNIPVSLYSRLTQQLIDYKHVFIPDYHDPTVMTFGLSGAGEATGTKSTYSFALFDIKTDQLMGSLGIDYIDQYILTDQQKTLLEQKAQRISGYLSSFMKN
jgi:hypothetical protein